MCRQLPCYIIFMTKNTILLNASSKTHTWIGPWCGWMRVPASQLSWNISWQSHPPGLVAPPHSCSGLCTWPAGSAPACSPAAQTGSSLPPPSLPPTVCDVVPSHLLSEQLGIQPAPSYFWCPVSQVHMHQNLVVERRVVVGFSTLNSVGATSECLVGDKHKMIQPVRDHTHCICSVWLWAWVHACAHPPGVAEEAGLWRINLEISPEMKSISLGGST